MGVVYCKGFQHLYILKSKKWPGNSLTLALKPDTGPQYLKVTHPVKYAFSSDYSRFSFTSNLRPVAGSAWFVFPADCNVFGATAQTIRFPQQGLRRLEVKRNRQYYCLLLLVAMQTECCDSQKCSSLMWLDFQEAQLQSGLRHILPAHQTVPQSSVKSRG